MGWNVIKTRPSISLEGLVVLVTDQPEYAYGTSGA
jgi:hypothetical protein